MIKVKGFEVKGLFTTEVPPGGSERSETSGSEGSSTARANTFSWCGV